MFSSVIFWCESCCPTLLIIAFFLFIYFSPLGSHFVLDSDSGIPPGKPGGCCHLQNQPPSLPNTHLDSTCGCLCWVLGLFPGLIIFRSRNTLKVTGLKGLSLPPQWHWNTPKFSFPEAWHCCSSLFPVFCLMGRSPTFPRL